MARIEQPAKPSRVRSGIADLLSNVLDTAGQLDPLNYLQKRVAEQPPGQLAPPPDRKIGVVPTFSAQLTPKQITTGMKVGLDLAGKGVPARIRSVLADANRADLDKLDELLTKGTDAEGIAKVINRMERRIDDIRAGRKSVVLTTDERVMFPENLRVPDLEPSVRKRVEKLVGERRLTRRTMEDLNRRRKREALEGGNLLD